MGILVNKGKVFITVEEIVNYLQGIKQDMNRIKETNKKEIMKRIEDPELQKLILKIDSDNFGLFNSKLDYTIKDLGRHLTHSMMKATRDSEKRKKSNKCACSNCKKEYKSKSSLIYLIGLEGTYNLYCDDCFKIQINDYITRGILKPKEGLKLDELKHKDLIGISGVCDVVVQNYIFSHPKMLNKVMNGEPMQKLKKELGLGKGNN